MTPDKPSERNLERAREIWKRSCLEAHTKEELPEIMAKNIAAALDKAVLDFYDRVCKKAEGNMLKTGKLEGAHFAAMRSEIEEIRALKGKP